MNICKNWTQWLLETRFASMTPEMRQQTLNWLQIVRDNILVRANIKPNQTIIDIGTGTGLLAFKVLEDLKGTGEIIFSDKFQDCLDNCENILKQNDVKSGYRLIQCPAENIPLEARIMALADVFDALVSKRCYKEKMSYDTVFSIIEESLGKQFDEKLGKLFLKQRDKLIQYYNSVEE